MTRIDFNAYAAAYATNRFVQPMLLDRLVTLLAVEAGDSVLEVGCGTANYARAIAQETGAEIYGIDPHPAMIEQAGDSLLHLQEGSAGRIPFPDSAFDALYSVDVIHHVQDRSAYAAEALRVLKQGGRFLTATDSEEDILGRIPLSSHFPESIPHELARYPTTPEQTAQLKQAGFAEVTTEAIAYEYDLTDLGPYEARAFSALRLIDADAWRAGLARLRADLERGPLAAVSRYTIVRARKP